MSINLNQDHELVLYFISTKALLSRSSAFLFIYKNIIIYIKYN